MPGAWDVSDVVLLQQLQTVVDNWFSEQVFKVMLYKNDYVPVPGTVLADLVEADFAGYGWYNLPGSTFGAASVTDHVATTTSSDTAVFTATPFADAQTIYGYALLNEDGDDLRWVERFDTPRLVSPGDTLNITARLRYQTLPAS